MATETIEFHGSVGVARFAELALCIDGNRCAIAPSLTMTIYAPAEAVALTPYAVQYHIITLVIKKLHMIAPHDRRGFHASVTLRGTGNMRSWHRVVGHSPA